MEHYGKEERRREDEMNWDPKVLKLLSWGDSGSNAVHVYCVVLVCKRKMRIEDP
jgi:hypothetical protein